MEADVEGLIGAGRHERTGDRLNYRNGYRDRSLDTRLGSLQLGTIGNFVRRLGMIGAKELENAATQGTPHPGCHP